VSPDDCKTGTHLVAHGATLTEVLQRMSAVLGFKLHVGEPSASIVDVNLSGRGPDLVAKLAQSSNLMVRTSRYPQCPGRYRISEVWMLPGGVSAPRITATTSPLTPELIEANKKQDRENAIMYRKAHGLPLDDE
jgi:hypothetical protein